MDAVVEQALGDIHGRHALGTRRLRKRHDELMGRTAVRIRQLEARVFQSPRQVVGVQRGVFAHPMHALPTEHQRVGERAQQNAGVSGKGRQTANARRQIGVAHPAVRALPVRLDERYR